MVLPSFCGIPWYYNVWTFLRVSGPCECPNFCHNTTNQGICTSGGCICAAGWKGRDCGMVDCSTTKCSGQGTCHTNFGVDFCDCNAGFTGPDCSSPSVSGSGGNNPYGYLFSILFWPTKDRFWDQSTGLLVMNMVTSIRFSIDLCSPLFIFSLVKKIYNCCEIPCLWPKTTLTWRQTWYSSQERFKSLFQRLVSNQKVGFLRQLSHMRGLSSRPFAKKSFKVDFNNFFPKRSVPIKDLLSILTN